MDIRNRIKNSLVEFWKDESGFIGGLISAGLGIASSIFGNKSAKKQTAAVNQGFNYLKGNEGVNQAQQFGSQAAGLQAGLLGLGGDQAAAEQAFQQYQDSTGYQFRLGQGMDAIEGSRAARGVLNSGATAKELTQYGQNMASAEFNNYLDRLGQQQQVGLNSAYQVASSGANAGSQAAGIEADRSSNMMSGIGGLARGVASIFGF